MGVPGLYSYFASKALGQRKSWTTPDVPSNKSSEPTTDRSDSDDRRDGSGSSCTQKRYFILDGNAYIHHLYCGQFEWVWGGQYPSFTNLLTAHINALRDCGFQIQVLFDGPLPLQKLQTRLTRDTEKIKKMGKVMGDLDHYPVMGLNSHAGVLAGGSDELVQKTGGGRWASSFLIPPLVLEATLQTLRSLGVDLMVCEGEADGLVARLAMERSMDENVTEAYAVSKDSDYFIYNTGPSGKGGYIPFDSLSVSSDPRSKKTIISATVYSQSAIANHLGIKPQFLPLFASLTGNDYLMPGVFEVQITKSLVGATGNKPGASTAGHTRIKETAAFLKQYGAGSGASIDIAARKRISKEKKTASDASDEVKSVMEEILENRKKLYYGETEAERRKLRTALEESMGQYSVTVPTGPLSSTTPSTTAVSGLDKIKEAFRLGQFSFKLMDVVNNKMFWCTPFLEDTDRESAWLASREMRRWIYGILARSLMADTSKSLEDSETDQEFSSTFDVVEYVRRGDHLSAEHVMAVSGQELDEVLKSVKAKANKRNTRRVSVMDVDPIASDAHDTISSDKDSYLDVGAQDPSAKSEGELDEDSRVSLFLGVLGADTAQVRALPRSFMVLAAALRYMINALAHSKTRSASISVANFEVIAFVASALFLRERYYPETIQNSVRSDGDHGSQPSRQRKKLVQLQSRTIPDPKTLSSFASLSLSGSSTLEEAPPLTKRSIHLSSQYQYVITTVSLLANALHLEAIMPSLATLFDGLLFQQTLALARGGTLLEQRMQSPELVNMYYRILAAVEEDFIDTGEIDVAVVFRAPSGRKGHQQQDEEQRVSLGIFGSDMEPVNQPEQPASSTPSPVSLSPSSSSSSLSSSGWKSVKSGGVQKKSSGTSKKRQGGSGTGHSGNNGGGRSGSGGGRGGGGGGNSANMFSVLSLGCEF
ncbi:XPG domain containing-domain-containing protein [Mortierella sp. GBAus27b]|nr:hypothetical protein BGX31_005104 [Mortierella sp. GBA43]KAI8349514.1 XPG domain containing-domain-containing protein [Mortierella sp. GBAus27b]